MKHLFGFLLAFVFPAMAMAAYSPSGKMTCQNDNIKLVLKSKGSYFGEDRILISEMGQSVLDEEASPVFDPTGRTELEKQVQQDSPDEYYLTTSDNTELIVAKFFSNGRLRQSTVYVRMQSTNETLKFDYQTECRESLGF